MVLLSPYSTGNGVCIGYPMRMKSTQKKKKCTWPKPEFCVGTQRHLYSTDWRRGLASGLMQILGLALGVWRRGFGVGGLASGNVKKYTNMLVYFALGNAQFWRWVHCPTPTPDARYFAFWWNIGFKLNLNQLWHIFRVSTLKIQSQNLFV